MDGDLPVVSESPFGGPVAPPVPAPGSPAAGGTLGKPRSAGPLERPAGGRAERSPGRRLAAKFGAYIKAGALLLPKLKLLTTASTALVSVAAYSLLWGWPFAAGFVALLFVHEMGHVIQLRREGIKASTPMFIPFLGAAIFSRSLGDNALAEARVGLAGPILGTLGAVGVAVAGALTGSDLLLALA